jgi:hypothetical protein
MNRSCLLWIFEEHYDNSWIQQNRIISMIAYRAYFLQEKQCFLEEASHSLLMWFSSYGAAQWLRSGTSGKYGV